MTKAGARQALPVWTVEFDDRARRELRKLDPGVQQEILRYLLRAHRRIARSETVR